MNLGTATEEYAAKYAALPLAREQLDDEQFELFEEDLAKAWREVEIAWLRAHPEER